MSLRPKVDSISESTSIFTTQYRISLSGKKYQCTMCSHWFGSRTHTKEHVTGVHLKLSLFPCQLCDANFRYRSALVSHRTKHHPEVKVNDDGDKGKKFTAVKRRASFQLTVTDCEAGPAKRRISMTEITNNNNYDQAKSPTALASRSQKSMSLKKSPRKSLVALSSPVNVGNRAEFEFSIDCAQCQRKFQTSAKLKRHVQMAHYGTSK